MNHITTNYHLFKRKHVCLGAASLADLPLGSTSEWPMGPVLVGICPEGRSMQYPNIHRFLSVLSSWACSPLLRIVNKFRDTVLQHSHSFFYQEALMGFLTSTFHSFYFHYSRHKGRRLIIKTPTTTRYVYPYSCCLVPFVAFLLIEHHVG